MKRTPGEWVFFEEMVLVDRDGDNQIIADLNDYNGQGVGDKSERIANAHLCSAAPDLLSALKRLMRAHVKQIIGTDPTDEEVGEFVGGDFAEPLAAIAKAEGKSK